MDDVLDFLGGVDKINTLEDYRRAKRWMKKIRRAYTFFTLVAVIEILIFFRLPTSLFEDGALPIFVLYILMPIGLILANWGCATLLLNLKSIFKGLAKTVRKQKDEAISFANVETKSIYVTKVDSNTYRANTVTEKGGSFLVAIVASYVIVNVKIFLWCAFCVYIGSFLAFWGYRNTAKLVKACEFGK